jgi:hypothetical protein
MRENTESTVADQSAVEKPTVSDSSIRPDAPSKKTDVLMGIFFVFMGLVSLGAVVFSLQGHDGLSMVILLGVVLTIWRVLRWRYPTTARK